MAVMASAFAALAIGQAGVAQTLQTLFRRVNRRRGAAAVVHTTAAAGTVIRVIYIALLAGVSQLSLGELAHAVKGEALAALAVLALGVEIAVDTVFVTIIQALAQLHAILVLTGTASAVFGLIVGVDGARRAAFLGRRRRGGGREVFSDVGVSGRLCDLILHILGGNWLAVSADTSAVEVAEDDGLHGVVHRAAHPHGAESAVLFELAPLHVLTSDA